jgi:hypothetical protein
VGQLIEILQSFPQDAEILIPGELVHKKYAKKVYYSEEYENVVIE